MSIEALTWALNLAPIPADETSGPNGRSLKPSSTCAFVLVALANHAGPDGTGAYPSIATLQRYTRLSERSVQRAIARLESFGIITRGSAAHAAVYIKRLDRLPQVWDLRLDLLRTDITLDDIQRMERTIPGVTARYEALFSRGVTLAPREDDQGLRGVAGCGHEVSCVCSRGVTMTPELKSNQLQEPLRTSRRETASPSPDPTLTARPDVLGLCNLLADLIEANGSRRPRVSQVWLDECRRLLDIDKIPVNKAENVMRWSQQSTFWRKNILSMVKFRLKYDALRLAALEEYERNRQLQQGAASRPSTTDRRVSDALEIGRKMQARLESEQRELGA